MATRSRTSFQKRQKEIARAEKQRDKAAKRAQRKLNPPTESDDETATDEMNVGEGVEGEMAEGETAVGKTAEGESAPVVETPANGNHQ